jgi:hypothetical protein
MTSSSYDPTKRPHKCFTPDPDMISHLIGKDGATVLSLAKSVPHTFIKINDSNKYFDIWARTYDDVDQVIRLMLEKQLEVRRKIVEYDLRRHVNTVKLLTDRFFDSLEYEIEHDLVLAPIWFASGSFGPAPESSGPVCQLAPESSGPVHEFAYESFGPHIPFQPDRTRGRAPSPQHR